MAAAKANNARDFNLHRIGSIRAAITSAEAEIAALTQRMLAQVAEPSYEMACQHQLQLGRQHVLGRLLTSTQRQQEVTCRILAIGGL